MTLADAGYYSGSNLSECAGRGQGVAMPETSQRQSRGHPYHKDRFAYDESSDSFMCPQGRVLPFERIHISSKGAHFRFYRAPGAICRACPAFGVCTKSKDGRNVSVGPYDAALRRHRAWMATSAAKEAYKLRKQLVEPVFGIIKEQQGGPEVPLARSGKRGGRVDRIGHSVQPENPLASVALPRLRPRIGRSPCPLSRPPEPHRAS